MQTTIFAAAIAATLVTAGSPAIARPADPLQAWVDRVSAVIEDAKAVPINNAQGEATVTFRRSPSGRAVDIAAQAPNDTLRQAAIRTALRLIALPPLPAGISADQPITVRLLFSGYGDDGFHARRSDRLAAAAVRSNTRFAALAQPTELVMNAPAQ